MSKWKLWSGLAALFLAGILIGSVGTGLFMKDRLRHAFRGGLPAVKAHVMKGLSNELDLSTDQKVHLAKIVSDTQEELSNFRKQHQQEIEKIIARSIDEMKKHLTPEQQKKLDALHEKAMQRWADHRRGRHGGPGGHHQPPPPSSGQ